MQEAHDAETAKLKAELAVSKEETAKARAEIREVGAAPEIIKRLRRSNAEVQLLLDIWSNSFWESSIVHAT